ncbi:MAG: PVC-type heme-binding CxxCH protein [Bacteroidota bacterium]
MGRSEDYLILRNKVMRGIILALLVFQLLTGCNTSPESSDQQGGSTLTLKSDDEQSTISVYRDGVGSPIVVQNAKSDFRPYLHPIVAPDGKGVLTEYSPGHHKHQTGLYWGFTRVNGMDYFHHPGDNYWQKVSADIITEEGPSVKWQTVHNLLDSTGSPVLKETQVWSMRLDEDQYILDLEWTGEAITDVTIGEYDYGGLFLRMPWEEGIKGEVINAARQKNEAAEGQRAMWVDVGMQVEGRDDLAHITIFDHTQNTGFPQPWRVDNQLGIGPVRARLGDWQIKKGESEIIKHEIRVYTGELDDVQLTQQWTEYVEGHYYSVAVLWDLAQQEGRTAKFLNPEEAVDAMTVKAGYQVNAWAAEPMITQPMAFCWDHKGRLWVAENRDYETRQTGFSASGDSRILIIEDTDHDGKADSRKVFLEGIPFPSAIAVGFDGLFLAAPPNLLFIPDADKDDKADLENIEVRLTGWGIRDRHETINSLHWGPDGWLYGLEGFATPSKIRKPIGEGHIYKHRDEFPEDLLDAEGVDINGGVWRYHPTKDIFEVVAHGFSNPWGIDYDAKGQLFISACVIPHLWHVIPGGIYQRQGGQHFNPYLYSDIQTIADHRHRSAHGGARVYLSDAFPEDQQGRIFMANIHEHAVLSDVLNKKGSGFVGTHGDDFMLANNAQWIGFSMELGPDGNLYVLDWHDADICGKDVLNKETGRVFRISPETSLAKDWPGRYDDLTLLSDLELAKLQTNKSSWHNRRARLILQERSTKGSISQDAIQILNKILNENAEINWKLNALWALHNTKNISREKLMSLLKDKNEYIRAWSIQLLCEDKDPGSQVIASFSSMAENDPSPVVRMYLAAAMQRIDPDQRWNVVQALSIRKEDITDHNIPHMLWFATEPLIEVDPNKYLGIARETEIPMISQYMARRMVDADQMEPLVAQLAQKGKNQVNLLMGFRDGLESRPGTNAPGNWDEVYKTIQSQGGEAAQIALNIAQQLGDANAAMQFMATLKDQGKATAERITALNSLADHQWPALQGLLPSLLDEESMRNATIKAIAAFNNNQLGRTLIENYPKFNKTDKLEAIQTLSSRTIYGQLLTNALKNEVIPKSDVPAYAARQLRRVVGNGFVEVWGPIDQLSGNQKVQYEKYRDLLSSEALSKANLTNGKQVFLQTCGPCHKLYGEGGTLGPDITGSNRQNLDYLLGNVLDPSGEIQDDYKMVVVTTRDGRTYSGNIATENDRTIALSLVGQDTVSIAKSNIQSREVTNVSMMPTGLWETLENQQIIDLVAYLQTSSQVAMK